MELVSTLLTIQDCPNKEVDDATINNIVEHYFTRISQEKERKHVEENVVRWLPERNKIIRKEKYNRSSAVYNYEIPIKYFVIKENILMCPIKDPQKYIETYFRKVYKWKSQ